MIKTIEDYWKLANDNIDNIKAITEMVNMHGYVIDKIIYDCDHVALVSFCNKVWFALPDNRGLHSIPGFYALCDLCSESWVFDR